MRTLRLGSMVALALLVAGCKVPPTKQGFNDKMARDNKKLAQLGKDFSRSLFEATKGGGAGTLRSRLTAIEDALRQIKDHYADAALPPGSNSAQGYLDAYKGFLDSQDKIVAKMRDIVAAAEGGNVGRATALQGELGNLEQNALNKLRDAQRAFSDEHHFRTVEKYGD